MEVFVAAIVVGLIPAWIAHSKGRNFFGWWFYGAALWIVATPHAILLKQSGKKCPFCAELVNPDARVCKHCNRNIEMPDPGPSPA